MSDSGHICNMEDAGQAGGLELVWVESNQDL